MPIRKKFEDAAHRICETVLPIKHEYFIGRGKELAICTLSSIDLPEEICKSHLVDKVAIARRLFSENRGIDVIIKFVLEHPHLQRIVLCGKEVKCHRAGQALLALARDGMVKDGRIIGVMGPYPVLKLPTRDVEAFRPQVEILDMIGIVDINSLILAFRG